MSGRDSEPLARRLAELADSKGASEIVVLDMRGLVSYTDFLVDLHGAQRAPGEGDRRRGQAAAEERARAAARRGRGGGRGRLDRPRLPRRGAARLHRRGEAALPARGPLAGGAAARVAAVAGWRPRAPLRCRAWVASRGRSSATAAAKWTRRFGARDARIWASGARAAEVERELTSLSRHGDRARARDPQPQRADLRRRTSGTSAASPRSRRSPMRLEEIEAQARGQATRIRMKALREAVEVSRRAQELAEVHDGSANAGSLRRRCGVSRNLRGHDQARDRPARRLLAAGRLRGGDRRTRRLGDLGRALLGGPGDALDAARRAGRPAARARRALAVGVQVRRTADDNLVLDVDEDEGPEQRAAERG